jgi:glutamyl-tRNA synthetase
MSSDEVFKGLSAWAKEFDPQFSVLLEKSPEYARSILNIGRGGRKPRKDLAVWKDARPYMSFFYDKLFEPEYNYPENMPHDDIISVLKEYGDIYSPFDDSTVWFDKIKSLSERLGYAPETRLYKASPDKYKGHVGDISMVLRVAVTGRQNSPDLYEVMALLGGDRIAERLVKAAEYLNR